MVKGCNFLLIRSVILAQTSRSAHLALVRYSIISLYEYYDFVETNNFQ